MRFARQAYLTDAGSRPVHVVTTETRNFVLSMGSDMVDTTIRHYTLHGEHECDRLELQARIAGIEGHLQYLPVSGGANILDAGCGSGSMARLLASKHPDATVTGFDLNGGYLDYARRIATHEGLTNITFREGDIQALPFADASFDLIWSKHVLFFVPRIADALREFRRTIRPGGSIVIALEHWPGVVLDPQDLELRKTLLQVLEGLADISITTRLLTMLMQAGFVDLSVEIDASKPYTIIGSIDSNRRSSHATEMDAARPYVAQVLGSEAAADEFYNAWFGYLDRADTSTVLPIWFFHGTAPISGK